MITDEKRQYLHTLDLLSLGDFAPLKQQTEVLDEVFEPRFLLELDAEHRVESELRKKHEMSFVKP